MLWRHALATGESLDRATELAEYCGFVCAALPADSAIAAQARDVALKAATSIKNKDDRAKALSELAFSIQRSVSLERYR